MFQPTNDQLHTQNQTRLQTNIPLRVGVLNPLGQLVCHGFPKILIEVSSDDPQSAPATTLATWELSQDTGQLSWTLLVSTATQFPTSHLMRVALLPPCNVLASPKEELQAQTAVVSPLEAMNGTQTPSVPRPPSSQQVWPGVVETAHQHNGSTCEFVDLLPSPVLLSQQPQALLALRPLLGHLPPHSKDSLISCDSYPVSSMWSVVPLL